MSGRGFVLLCCLTLSRQIVLSLYCVELLFLCFVVLPFLLAMIFQFVFDIYIYIYIYSIINYICGGGFVPSLQAVCLLLLWGVVVEPSCLQLRLIRHEWDASFFDVGASLKNCSCRLKEQSRAGPSIPERANCLQNKSSPTKRHF